MLSKGGDCGLGVEGVEEWGGLKRGKNWGMILGEGLLAQSVRASH